MIHSEVRVTLKFTGASLRGPLRDLPERTSTTSTQLRKTRQIRGGEVGTCAGTEVREEQSSNDLALDQR